MPEPYAQNVRVTYGIQVYGEIKGDGVLSQHLAHFNLDLGHRYKTEAAVGAPWRILLSCGTGRNVGHNTDSGCAK